MAEETKKNPHQLAEAGDEAAKRYIEWLKLEKRKQEILNKLKTTAGVDTKYRDPETIKAESEYYGSVPDLARRALEATSLPGNITKALVAPGDKGQQVANAIKAVAGKPEDAFRENLTKGSDVAKGLGVSAKNQELVGTGIDLASDVITPAAVGAGIKAVGKTGSAMASAAARAASKGEQAIAAKALKSSGTLGELGDIKDLPQAARSADEVAERAAMFNKIDDEQAAKKAFESANPVIPEQRVASPIVEEPSKSALDSLDIPEIAQVPTEQMTRAQELADKLKKIKEAAVSNKPIPMEAGPKQLSLPEGKYEGAVRQAMEEMNRPSTILQPGEPLNSQRLVQGLQKYGQSEAAKAPDRTKEALKKALEEAIAKKKSR